MGKSKQSTSECVSGRRRANIALSWLFEREIGCVELQCLYWEGLDDRLDSVPVGERAKCSVAPFHKVETS